MRKLASSVVVLSLLGISLVGCISNSTQGSTQDKNGMIAVFEMTPSPPLMMEPVSLALSLTGSSGEAIEGAQVSYELTMPGMTMPPNNPQTLEDEQGVYLADGVFTMAGEWRAQAIVVYGGETTTFTFDFSVE